LNHQQDQHAVAVYPPPLGHQSGPLLGPSGTAEIPLWTTTAASSPKGIRSSGSGCPTLTRLRTTGRLLRTTSRLGGARDQERVRPCATRGAGILPSLIAHPNGSAQEALQDHLHQGSQPTNF